MDPLTHQPRRGGRTVRRAVLSPLRGCVVRRIYTPRSRVGLHSAAPPGLVRGGTDSPSHGGEERLGLAGVAFHANASHTPAVGARQVHAPDGDEPVVEAG